MAVLFAQGQGPDFCELGIQTAAGPVCEIMILAAQAFLFFAKRRFAV
ncbi:MAG: hypothetical protein LBT97_08595 [Planctomycetota bacterium]|jgi:hypothetical protein|nr:hypothetical protein [Planctomycetota bacterium]